MADGISLLAIAVGLYGVSEILRNLETGTSQRSIISHVGSIWPSRSDLRRMVAPAFRGTAIGSLLGVLPGGGALLSSFIAYNIEKKVSKNSAEFGHGAIEGVVAPEAANNAGAQTSFIPMLGLGIPSSAIMALMIGAMMIQGIIPGPDVINRNPELFWGLIASMWVGNVMLVVLNLPLLGIWVSLLRVPYQVLFPAIVAISCIGVYTVNNSLFEVNFIAVAAIAGYIFVKLGCEMAPFILGFILGPMLEEHLRRAMVLADGDPTVLITQPISGCLLALAVAILAVVSIPGIVKARKRVFKEEEAL